MTKKGGRAGGAKGVRKPNAAVYLLVYLLIYPVFKICFRLKVDRGKFAPPKGPFIVLSNHTSFMDFLLTMLTIYPRRLNAVAAQKFYLYKPLNWLLPLMGCIPKNLFDPDIRSIKGIIKVLGRGGRVLLYPEGRCTVAGGYMGMHDSTGKLIKKFSVPVLSCRIDGAYNCMPFWRKGVRFGNVRVTLSNLFDADEIKVLSESEINKRIDARLSGADRIELTPRGADNTRNMPRTADNTRTAPHRVSKLRNMPRTASSRRLAEGLENILYYCPACGAEFTLTTSKNKITCSACGYAVTMARDGTFTPAAGGPAPIDAQDWYRAQCEFEATRLAEDMAPLNVEVDVRMPGAPGTGISMCGSGTLSLSPQGWSYDGELRGEAVRLEFPIATVPAMPFDPNDNFQIYANGGFYSFTPSGKPQACSKYATIGECAYWRFAAPIRMTPGQDSGFHK